MLAFLKLFYDQSNQGGPNMKIYLLALLIISSCASHEDRMKNWSNYIKAEADCKKISDVKMDQSNMNVGSSTSYTNAICDGRKIRCKSTMTVNPINAFASQTTLDCKDRK